MPTTQRSRHILNICLLMCIIAVNFYTILLPYWPALTFWWQKNHSSTEQSLVQTVEASNQIPTDNRLVVPEMLLNEPVLEGESPSTVDKGIWHLPFSSTPNQGGNTVLAAHRFTYDGKGVFYNLDKLHVGDSFALFWNNQKYAYTVTETKVVPATAVEIEAPTEDARLTMYTCTPLWTAKDRLVVVAKPVEDKNERE